MTELFFKNPITLWWRWLYTAIRLRMRYSHITIEYMAEVIATEFGKYNTVRKYSRLRNTSLGDYTYVGRDSQVYEARIGKFTRIGPRVTIGPGEHPTDRISIHPMFYSTKGQSNPIVVKNDSFEEMPITHIGHDVWIAQGAILRSGVHIGNGAVIAAGAVVVSDIPPYAIAGGVPAKVIRYRFDEAQRSSLERMEWWNWDEQTLRDRCHEMNNVDAFFSSEFAK